MRVDAGKDVWIVVSDENTYVFDYLPLDEVEPVETTEATEAESPAEAENDNGMMPMLLLAGAVAAGGGLFVYKKKKK
jgi:LPXTG-motif cell wall-anchored protein